MFPLGCTVNGLLFSTQSLTFYPREEHLKWLDDVPVQVDPVRGPLVRDRTPTSHP